MKAVVFPQPEQIVFESVPDPICQPDEVVIRVTRTGICGTDVHIFRKEYLSDFPLTPGHEFGGEIAEVGSRVTMPLKVGDRVAVDPNLYCGECEFCRREQANHCLNWQGIGVTRPGGFAEYVSVPARACYAVPDSLDDEQMALIEPLACIVYGMKRVRIAPADPVLLFGAGPIGLLLLQALRHSGAGPITVVEKQPTRLALAQSLGATHTLLAGPDLPEALADQQPYGFGTVVDATGVPQVIERGFDFLRPRGQYLIFGVAPMHAQIQIEPYKIFKNDWSVIGSFALCYTFQEAISWLESGVIDVTQLVSHQVPLDEFAPLFHQFAAGQTLKVQFTPGQKQWGD
jgi:2-desacetyl-2-hydroxyethyl bacteriochlorophyllide A dehydrogenase